MNNKTNASIILKPGRERSLLRRHPWIFSGAISRVEGDPLPGETVRILDKDGNSIGIGAWSPASQIRVRMWSFNPGEEVDTLFFRSRLSRSLSMRNFLFREEKLSAFRVVYSESDYIPGLILDRYGDYLVCQFLSAGTAYWKEEILSSLSEMIPCKGIFERSDTETLEKEGLPRRTGVLLGDLPPKLISVEEGECLFRVDVRQGHKTGFYLDQRENRRLLSNYASGREVLNCFSYTGAFGIYALKAGASHVTNVDTSSSALDLSIKNLELNCITPGRAGHLHGDVFNLLRSFRDTGRVFDLIILDPPRFVDSRARLIEGSRGYKDINLLAFRLLRPGGILFTFSCSGLMPPELFQKIVADAALDAGRDARILHTLSQSCDHPVALNFPEGRYLKGLVIRVD